LPSHIKVWCFSTWTFLIGHFYICI
jgi:hypothetical protein